jgi:anti-sigma regulatory factor (Ser/Thr protein kinase)
VPSLEETTTRGERGGGDVLGSRASRDDPLPDRPRGRERERLAAAASATVLEKAETLSIMIPRDTHYLAIVRKVVADVGCRAGFRGEDLDKIELAVDEACSNAMIYQVDHQGAARFERLELEVTIARPRFVVVLRDHGERYPFEDQGNFDLEDHLRRMEPGGLGIYIIKNFMDEVSYEHSARSGNVLTMTKYLGDELP